MIYAVLDTNVLVSALWTKSANTTIKQLIDAVADGKIITLYHEEIIAEYEEMLSRKKFGFLPKAREALVELIVEMGINSERVAYDAMMPDEDDRVFYEVALSKEDAYLVTGNGKHFPVTPIVVTPAEMLEILNEAELR